MEYLKNELRIGNTIEQGVIVELLNHEVLVNSGDHASEIVAWEDVKPIELTRDLLERAGFKKVVLENGYHFSKSFAAGIEIATNDSLFNKGEDRWCLGILISYKGDIFNNCEWKHLHNLENLHWDYKRTHLKLEGNEA